MCYGQLDLAGPSLQVAEPAPSYRDCAGHCTSTAGCLLSSYDMVTKACSLRSGILNGLDGATGPSPASTVCLRAVGSPEKTGVHHACMRLWKNGGLRRARVFFVKIEIYHVIHSNEPSCI